MKLTFSDILQGFFSDKEVSPWKRRLVLVCIVFWHVLHTVSLWGKEASFISLFLSKRESADFSFSKLLLVTYRQFDAFLGLVPFLQVAALLMAFSNFIPRFWLILGWYFTWNLNTLQAELLDGGNNLAFLLLTYSLFLKPFWSSVTAKEQSSLRGQNFITNFMEQLSNIGLGLGTLQVVFVYLTAGLCKLIGKKWQEGTALYYILQNQDFTLPVFRNIPKLLPLVTVALSYFTVFFQLLFVPLVFSRYRGVALILGLSFHVGIAVVMGLWHFALIMCLSYAWLLTESESKSLFSERCTSYSIVTVGLDSNCAICLRFGAIMKRLSRKDLLILDSAQRPVNRLLSQIPIEQRLSKMWCVDAHGQLYAGFDAVCEMAGRAPFLGFFARIIKFSGLGDSVYKIISKSRWRRSCQQGVCQRILK